VLTNTRDVTVALEGWSLVDAVGKRAFLHDTLAAGDELILPYSVTKISLNNSGETIKLYNDTGVLIDTLSFTGTIREGALVTRSEYAIDYDEMIQANTFTTFSHNSFSNGVLLMIMIAMLFSLLSVYIARTHSLLS
jgi:hypothetical protein